MDTNVSLLRDHAVPCWSDKTVTEACEFFQDLRQFTLKSLGLLEGRYHLETHTHSRFHARIGERAWQIRTTRLGGAICQRLRDNNNAHTASPCQAGSLSAVERVRQTAL
jgi:hypothetical protein